MRSSIVVSLMSDTGTSEIYLTRTYLITSTGIYISYVMYTSRTTSTSFMTSLTTSTGIYTTITSASFKATYVIACSDGCSFAGA